MQRILIAALLIITLSARAEETPPRTVSVTGEGFVEVEPDRAEIVLTVEKEKLTTSEAKAEVDAAVVQLLEMMDRMDIPEESVNSTRLRINPMYNHNRGTRTFRGFNVSRQLQVTLKDLDKLEALLEQSVQKGITRINPPRLYHSKEEELKAEARAKASDNAIEKAEALADHFGSELGEIRSVSMQAAPVVRPFHDPFGAPRAAMSMEAGGGGSDTLRLGLIKIHAVVYAVFDLQ